MENVFSGGTGGAALPKPAARARAKKATNASPDSQTASAPSSDVKTEGVLGGGVKKKRGTAKRGVRPKIQDFISDGSEPATPATPTKATKGGKKSTFKAEVKDEDLAFLSPIALSQYGEEPMEMDNEDPLGQITPPQTRPAEVFNNDSDLEVTGSAVVKGRGKASVQVHPAYTGSFFNPLPVQASPTGHGYEGFVPGNCSSPLDSLELGTTTGNHFLTTFGGIKERNPDHDDDDVPAMEQQHEDIAPSIAIPCNDTGGNGGLRGSIDDINFASMMTSNLPGGGSSNSYASPTIRGDTHHTPITGSFDPNHAGYGFTTGPPDIFQPTPTRALFGGNVEVLGAADSYFAAPTRKHRARKPPAAGDTDEDPHVV